MIPPLPTINDAIGLLAALSDPEKAKAQLEELKAHVENAQKIFDDAHGAQRAVDEEAASRMQQRNEISKQRQAFAEERNQFASMQKAKEKANADTMKALTDKQMELNKREDALTLRDADITAREQALPVKEQRLREREGQLVAKEIKHEELMKVFQPVMEMLK